jgi:tRNA (guanine-N7-)-methyltransferase
MMNSPKPLYRVGRETFETDEVRLQRALARYEEGKGLIGGDPARRPPPRHPSPLTTPPAFRLLSSAPEHLNTLKTFLTTAPLEIEIGSGRGEFILDWAKQHPQRHFLAFEVKSKLARRLLKKIRQEELSNLWVSDDDARYDLPRLLSPASVDVFHILFPDPWWKPKHQIRRLFVPPFVDILAILLRPGGILRIATDVPGYAEHIQTILDAHPDLSIAPPDTGQRFQTATPTSRQVFCDDIQRPYQFLYYSKVV